MSYASAADERDENLHRKIAMHIDYLADAYHEWAQAEVRDAITELQIQLQLEHAAPLKVELTDALERTTHLNTNELDRLRQQMKERERLVRDGEFQNFRDGREHLEEVIARYEAATQELLRIRSLAMALALGTDPVD
jgi:hypothetical protein